MRKENGDTVNSNALLTFALNIFGGVEGEPELIGARNASAQRRVSEVNRIYLNN
jgi:hypothetical protein